MHGSTDRLRLAPDDHSASRFVGQEPKTTSEGPACHLGGGQDVCRIQTRGLSTPHRCETNEDADMAESTRGRDPVDRWTLTSGVNITPPQCTGPVTTTYTTR